MMMSIRRPCHSCHIHRCPIPSVLPAENEELWPIPCNSRKKQFSCLLSVGGRKTVCMCVCVIWWWWCDDYCADHQYLMLLFCECYTDTRYKSEGKALWSHLSFLTSLLKEHFFFLVPWLRRTRENMSLSSTFYFHSQNAMQYSHYIRLNVT